MAQVLFFTKPGCVTGEKQLDLLRKSGHDVEVRSIIDHPWGKDELRAFFGDLPVKEWFNPNSPRVKSEEIIPQSFDESAALEAMVADHLLIRRPLIQVGSRRVCGFDREMLKVWIGLAATSQEQKDFSTCSMPTRDCTP